MWEDGNLMRGGGIHLGKLGESGERQSATGLNTNLELEL
jgi:hypothetical protein